MIIHQLIRHHIRHGADSGFYAMQSTDAIRWLNRNGVTLGKGCKVLDLGCGSGVFGIALKDLGCEVLFADASNWLPEDLEDASFQSIDIDNEDVSQLGQFDLVICSNVLEHLRNQTQLINSFSKLLKPDGHIYLSWTNWLSPWGGHDFSPFHYLGPRLGPALYDRIVRKPRVLIPFENLFPTHIGTTIKMIRARQDLEIVRVAPRYYTELAWLMKIPLLREFIAWNCAILIKHRAAE